MSRKTYFKKKQKVEDGELMFKYLFCPMSFAK